MNEVNSAIETLVQSSNTYFLLIGAIMVFAMHAGFAFLEVGTVRHKNQVNALVKIITDFAVSTPGDLTTLSSIEGQYLGPISEILPEYIADLCKLSLIIL